MPFQMTPHYQYPYSYLLFDNIHVVTENTTGSESGNVNEEAVNQNPHRGQPSTGGASNFVRNPSPTRSESASWYDDTLPLILLNPYPESLSLCDRLGTLWFKYLDASEKLIRSKIPNLLVTIAMIIGSIPFIGMGLGYMNKCGSSILYPMICVFLGGVGIVFAVCNILIRVKSCRIRDCCNFYESLAVGTLLFYVILCGLALWKITDMEVESALAELPNKCDPVFMSFFKVNTVISYVFTNVMLLVYLPLLFCCKNRCNCHRCC